LLPAVGDVRHCHGMSDLPVGMARGMLPHALRAEPRPPRGSTLA
jgi:hypothetical protein